MSGPSYSYVLVTLANGQQRLYEAGTEDVWGVDVWTPEDGRLVIQGLRYADDERGSSKEVGGVSHVPLDTLALGEWRDYELLEHYTKP